MSVLSLSCYESEVTITNISHS